jgi:drug/metabolite transporter (DMT)-like permease
LPSRHDLLYFLLLGFLGFTFYNLALNTGELQIAAGPAALLVQTGPIWTALLAVLFLGERLRLWGWLGIAISFLGALVIALGKWGDLSLSWAAALILLAAFSSSAYSIIQKRLLARYRPVELTAYAIWGGTLLLLPFAGGLWTVMQTAPLASTLAIVYLGIFPAALAYAAWAYVLSRLPASRAVSILYGVPVMAFLVGWVWLGEAPRLLDIVGGLLALSGVLVVNTLGRVRPSVTGH